MRLSLPPVLLLLLAGLVACGPKEGTATAAPVPPAPAAPASPPAPAPAGAAADAPASPVAAAPAATEPRIGDVLSDHWYDQRVDGMKNGWYHMVWTRSERDGAPTIHDHTEMATAETRDMGGQQDVFEASQVTDLERAPDGTLLHQRTVTTQGDRTTELEISRDAAGYVLVERVAGHEERRTVATAGGVPVDSEAFLAPKIRAGEVSVGTRLTYPQVNWTARALDTVELHVEAQEDLSTAAGMARCWRVVETRVGRPGTTTWWLDETGALARCRSGTTVVERTTESKARTLDPSSACYSITVRASPELPRATSLDRAVVDVTVAQRDGDELPEFPATPFSRVVSQEGNRFRVELLAHDDPAATTALPVTEPSVAKGLEATALYAPSHPTVRRDADAVLRSLPEAQRRDGRAVAKALLRRVFALRKESGPIPQPTAPEIVDAGMGDCSEHAVLFVALCRSVGLPARRLSGYAQVGDLWGAHSFCEVWLGKWVGADPTTNELGTRARYLAFGWDEDPDSYPGLVSQRVTGRLKIRTVEFTDAGETLSIGDALRRKPLRDDLAGIAFADPLPAGWKVSFGASAGTAHVSGPGVDADLHVSAGMGDLDADLLRSVFRGSRDATFGGLPALRTSSGLLRRDSSVTWIVPWRRRILFVAARLTGASQTQAEAALARVLAPTLDAAGR